MKLALQVNYIGCKESLFSDCLFLGYYPKVTSNDQDLGICINSKNGFEIPISTKYVNYQFYIYKCLLKQFAFKCLF
jgi:hypothetical protein